METIGYVHQSDPFHDRKAWSGSIYKIREGIEKSGYRVAWIPVKQMPAWMKILILLQKLFCKRGTVTVHANLRARLVAMCVDKHAAEQCDIIFFPGGAHITKYWKPKQPVVYYTDATYHIMVDYYWKNQSQWICKQAEKNERIGHDNSTLIIKASQWAADSAINDYGQNPSKVCVLEFGANVDDKDIRHITPWTSGELRVLFSGVDWNRKGAAIAIDTIKLLNEQGIKAKLLLTGIRSEVVPEPYRNLSYVEYVGFLNKNNPKEYKQYIDTISNSHIFLLPTKAECAGIVFSEASAYGLPIFAYNTGGIGNYVVDGVNGYKIKLTEGAEGFVQRIMACIKNKEFAALSTGGLKLYQEKLSWSAWSVRFRKMMEEFGL